MQDAFNTHGSVTHSEKDHIGTVRARAQSRAKIRSFCIGEWRSPDPARVFHKLFFELESARRIIPRNKVCYLGEVHLSLT